jgi:hypothetical protein
MGSSTFSPVDKFRSSDISESNGPGSTGKTYLEKNRNIFFDSRKIDIIPLSVDKKKMVEKIYMYVGEVIDGVVTIGVVHGDPKSPKVAIPMTMAQIKTTPSEVEHSIVEDEKTEESLCEVIARSIASQVANIVKNAGKEVLHIIYVGDANAGRAGQPHRIFLVSGKLEDRICDILEKEHGIRFPDFHIFLYSMTKSIVENAREDSPRYSRRLAKTVVITDPTPDGLRTPLNNLRKSLNDLEERKDSMETTSLRKSLNDLEENSTGNKETPGFRFA